MSAAQPTSAPATDPDVVVIGGGLAGLLAARRLSAAGQRVVVLEAGNRPGRMVAAARVDVVGAWLDGNGIGPVIDGVERRSPPLAANWTDQ